jgi:hypothetical protein
MRSSADVRLHIGNAIPPANEAETAQVIALWENIDDFFRERPFVAQSGTTGAPRPYLISLDAGSLVALLKRAREQSGSLTHYRKARVDDAGLAVDTELLIKVTSDGAELEEEECYQVVTVFIQQLLMAAHIIQPGSLQMLDARFLGEDAHRYEAQSFDAKIHYGARRTANDNRWPKFHAHSLETVWRWLEGCEVSQGHTAIKDINKVLFTLVKVAQQRLEYSARTALLVMYQLEVLLDCRHVRSAAFVAERARLILGKIPDTADRLSELHEVCNKLFVASRPVHRPPLICHHIGSVLREQIGQQSSPVESATAIVLVLLQDLIAHGAYDYHFSESFSRE